MIGSVNNIDFVGYGVCKTGATSFNKVLAPYATDLSKHQPRLSINKDISQHFKFLIVRNPWDRYVSLYEWGNQIWSKPLAKDFTDFIERLVSKKGFLSHPHSENWTRPQIDWTLDSKGNYDYSYIGKFENLPEAWNNISNRLKLIDVALRHDYKTKRKPYQDYYNKHTAKLIQDFCKKDIEMFDYKF